MYSDVTLRIETLSLFSNKLFCSSSREIICSLLCFSCSRGGYLGKRRVQVCRGHGTGGATRALARPPFFKAKGKFFDSSKFSLKALKKTCFRQFRRANFRKFSPVGANHGGASLDTKPWPYHFQSGAVAPGFV